LGLSEDPFDVGSPLATQYNDSPLGYTDFAIPWSLNVDFSYNFSRFGLRSQRSATINTGFDFNLTPNWKVQGRTGYDFIEHDIVLTNVSILRDFECWEMAISWVPFGPYQSYSFDLHVKSGHLRDILRLRQPRSDVRGQFGRLTN
ncbi:MAG: LPS-assembly protein LptD, partial [Rhodothermales bacterium]